MITNFLNYCIKSKNELLFQINPETMFVVTSTINPAMNPLIYSSIRSVYSNEERYKQTLITIQSIKQRIPNAFICLLENSLLTDSQKMEFEKNVNLLMSFSNDAESIRFRDCPNKGIGELDMLIKSFSLLKQINYKKCFKVSGRYCLNDNFKSENFSSTEFTFLPRDNVYSTRLYSFPKILEEKYIALLKKVVPITLANKGIEEAFVQVFPNNLVKKVNVLGIEGYIAVTKDFINE